MMWTRRLFGSVLLYAVLLYTVLIALFLFASSAHAVRTVAVDREIDRALVAFQKIDGTDTFSRIAKGALVLPKVYKAGIGIDGEYGEGAATRSTPPTSKTR